MLEHIITKMVLDRTCPVCNGLQEYRTTDSARTIKVTCNNCGGKGFMSDTEPSILVVESIAAVPPGIALSMGIQKMYVVDNTNVSEFLAAEIKRLYSYNVRVDCHIMQAMIARKPKEIHLYFD